MKRLLIAVAVVATTTGFATPTFADDVGVSISIGQPGFYGRLDIGDYPPPQVIYSQPVVIDRRPSYGAPVYLRVPPDHAKHWSRYCRHYNACGEQVYFVKDNWYNREYVPRYQEKHRERRDGHDAGHNGNHDKNNHGGDHGKGHGEGHNH